jgi:FkbM family methyltransferase
MRLNLIPQRLAEAVKLEFKSLITPKCGILYALRKWKAVILNKREIQFLGKNISYEDRLAPFTIFDYVNEINYTKKLFGFSGGRVLDIGANIGIYGSVISELFPGSAVYSFEPNLLPFLHLKENSSTFSTWHVFNFGVSSSSEEVDFYYVQEKTGQGSIYRENASLNLLEEGAIVSTKVTLKPLDAEFLTKNCGGNYFRLVKIDVEGAERSVVEGLSNITFKYMYVEMSSGREGASSVEEFLELLRKVWPFANIEIIKVLKGPITTDIYIKNNCNI